MRGCSFDIGMINSAIYIEEFDQKLLLNLPYNKKTNFKSIVNTNEFKSLLEKIYLNGKCIFTELFSSVDERYHKKTKVIGNQNLLTINRFLDSIVLLLDNCDFFIIEQQYQEKFKKNTTAVHIEHHLQSYLLNRYGPFRPIIIFPSKHKTKSLGAPLWIKKKPQRKKWCKEQAEKILKNRHDISTYKKIFIDNKKRDDFCDAIMQFQASKLLIFVTKKI